MSRRIAIGDIHGCSQTLKALLFEKVKITASDKIYLLGDYIDRGPDSKGVLDLILKLKNSEYNVTALRGNHEQFLLNAYQDPSWAPMWIRNGGEETLRSLGYLSVRQISSTYLDLLEAMPHYTKTDTAFLVHAGFNFKNSQPFQDYESMLMIRDMEVDIKLLDGRLVVHGHTPKPMEEIVVAIEGKGPLINLDNGCVYSQNAAYGRLLALDIENFTLWSQVNIED